MHWNTAEEVAAEFGLAATNPDAMLREIAERMGKLAPRGTGGEFGSADDEAQWHRLHAAREFLGTRAPSAALVRVDDIARALVRLEPRAERQYTRAAVDEARAAVAARLRLSKVSSATIGGVVMLAFGLLGPIREHPLYVSAKSDLASHVSGNVLRRGDGLIRDAETQARRLDSISTATWGELTSRADLDSAARLRPPLPKTDADSAILKRVERARWHLSSIHQTLMRATVGPRIPLMANRALPIGNRLDSVSREVRVASESAGPSFDRFVVYGLTGIAIVASVVFVQVFIRERRAAALIQFMGTEAGLRAFRSRIVDGHRRDPVVVWDDILFALTGSKFLGRPLLTSTEAEAVGTSLVDRLESRGVLLRLPPVRGEVRFQVSAAMARE